MRIARFERIDLIAIAAGGLIGATVRWLLTDLTAGEAADGGWFEYSPNTSGAPNLAETFTFPWWTLMANLIGCVVLGAIVTFRKQALGNARIMLATALGFCGSLTTFSTFAVEVAARLRYSETFTVSSTIEGLESAGEPLRLAAGGLSPATQGLAYLAVSVIGAGFAFNMGRQAATRNDA